MKKSNLLWPSVAVLATALSSITPASMAVAQDAEPVSDEVSSSWADDPRSNLAPGFEAPETAISNMELITLVEQPEAFNPGDDMFSPTVFFDALERLQAGEDVEPPTFITFANTDLAFQGDKVIMGNWHGFYINDLSDMENPETVLQVVCPGGQGDISIYGNLVFRSVEDASSRTDCGSGGVEGQSSPERFLGVQIFDISNMDNPRLVGAVQTCRGSHTHTLVPHPSDDGVIYIYNQGTSGPRPDTELAGCSGGEGEDTSLYGIDVIKLSLDAPETAEIVNLPRIFADSETGEIAGLWGGGAVEEGAQSSSVTNQCHDITVFPHHNLAAGACSGNGILLDITDPENPVRIADMSDPNFAYWHNATLNNEASSVVFGDEWGGGLGARCSSEDPKTWGADVIATISENGLEAQGYFKIPTFQGEMENCVAHNGSLIPVPGRDIMVQGWYQGGISVIDFTDPAKAFEIAYYDKGAIDEENLFLAGSWAGYWHNGLIYAPDMVRGLDILKLTPSEHLSEAEIAAAGLVTFEQANTQTQEYFEWPQESVVAQAYLDQLVRSEAISAELASGLQAVINGSSDEATNEATHTALMAMMDDMSERDALRLHGIGRVLGTH